MTHVWQQVSLRFEGLVSCIVQGIKDLQYRARTHNHHHLAGTEDIATIWIGGSGLGTAVDTMLWLHCVHLQGEWF